MPSLLPLFSRSLPNLRGRNRSRHRGVRRRSVRVTLAVLIAGTGAFTALETPTATATSPAVVVSSTICARYDPNIVSGACLQYQSRSGTAYTWIGTYRAAGGGIFYCIDYLYDSRISSTAARVSTAGLRNQLNRVVGAPEIAALNQLISTHAAKGTASSANGDAAIALIIRQVMGDGIRNDGTVVYPPGLKVNGVVKPLPGGAPAGIMTVAQKWWTEASAFRGPWTLKLEPTAPASEVPLGTSVSYAVRVLSAAARPVAGASVSFTCSGPIACPGNVVSSSSVPRVVTVKPSAMGSYVINASATGPSGQGQLLKGPWAAHGGTTATNAGVQRGWIAQRVQAKVSARGSAQVVKANPTVNTLAQATARPGEALTDLVTVAGLPPAYNHPMVATLYGPFEAAPTAASCAADKIAGAVTMPLTKDGTFRTPAVVVNDPGYYVWTESLVGDSETNAVETPCGVAEETTVVQASPQVRTVLSSQKVEEGALLRDTIEVSDAGETALTVGWSLFGPMSPVAGRCEDVDWSQAPLAEQGEIIASGNGRYRTPQSRVTAAGCYTYAEAVAGTPTTGPARTQPGEPAETTLLLDSPRLRTAASARKLVTPGSITDTITVSGVTTGTIDIVWELLGPIAPGRSGCAGLDWRDAPLRAHGMVSSGNGSVRTPPVRLTRVGCYTFREHSRAKATAAAADSPAGLPEETFLVTRSPMRLVPEVPTGPMLPLPLYGWLRTPRLLWAA